MAIPTNSNPIASNPAMSPTLTAPAPVFNSMVIPNPGMLGMEQSVTLEVYSEVGGISSGETFPGSEDVPTDSRSVFSNQANDPQVGKTMAVGPLGRGLLSQVIPSPMIATPDNPRARLYFSAGLLSFLHVLGIYDAQGIVEIPAILGMTEALATTKRASLSAFATRDELRDMVRKTFVLRDAGGAEKAPPLPQVMDAIARKLEIYLLEGIEQFQRRGAVFPKVRLARLYLHLILKGRPQEDWTNFGNGLAEEYAVGDFNSYRTVDPKGDFFSWMKQVRPETKLDWERAFQRDVFPSGEIFNRALKVESLSSEQMNQVVENYIQWLSTELKRPTSRDNWQNFGRFDLLAWWTHQLDSSMNEDEAKVLDTMLLDFLSIYDKGHQYIVALAKLDLHLALSFIEQALNSEAYDANRPSLQNLQGNISKKIRLAKYLRRLGGPNSAIVQRKIFAILEEELHRAGESLSRLPVDLEGTRSSVDQLMRTISVGNELFKIDEIYRFIFLELERILSDPETDLNLRVESQQLLLKVIKEIRPQAHRDSVKFYDYALSALAANTDVESARVSTIALLSNFGELDYIPSSAWVPVLVKLFRSHQARPHLRGLLSHLLGRLPEKKLRAVFEALIMLADVQALPELVEMYHRTEGQEFQAAVLNAATRIAYFADAKTKERLRREFLGVRGILRAWLQPIWTHFIMGTAKDDQINHMMQELDPHVTNDHKALADLVEPARQKFKLRLVKILFDTQQNVEARLQAGGLLNQYFPDWNRDYPLWNGTVLDVVAEHFSGR